MYGAYGEPSHHHSASPCRERQADEQPAQDRVIAVRDAKVGWREHQAANRKWPWRALWPWRSTLGMPWGLPSLVNWLALLA